MKKSILYEAGESIMEQMRMIKKCNDSELEVEVKRLDSMSRAGTALSSMADIQAKVLLHCGFLPESNFLTTENDVKLINSATNSKEKRKSAGLLIDEFKR